ncbi:adenylate/guanylate cyclase domain-containing protein [Belliella aquatica]|uniref:Adenylate/guanylate cyclase domain-containing response regulator n=1 Tax=Belliella aquatica TaxID=1323734 RepID=A0ABQ1LQ61_9BACT|nr:adenylate/guanylate cyclase domain-containing response regulator [Belliella aquatica]MCH7404173.1 response regulator [Belliella aquatica]GGC25898.1 adenylate/guanylate cyclase domain-containing response regulator [Belliella aquatica]
MAKILVVDDEEDLEILIKQKFRQKIRQNEYEFVFAMNGRHALEQLQIHKDIDIVLSDINMPEMDGLTLLSKLSEQNTLLKSVIVSAYGDMDNIRIAMNRGAFDFVTKPVNFADLEITIDRTMNHVLMLRDTLKAVKENNILKMYVDETVLNFMGGKEIEQAMLLNEIIEGTVVFIDICSFTSISENESADQVVELLNRYFDIMVQEIIKESGVVDKFIGDAIMAVFTGEYHIDRALDACLSIKRTLGKIHEESTDSGFKPKVSIGLNSGEMVSGNIGSSTLKRFDFTVIGDTVNVAARLQAAAAQNQILISSKSYELVKESFHCEKVGELNLKNKKEPFLTYQVLE